MLIVFLHGWSVTSTDTYGGLPEALVNNSSPNLDLDVTHLYLGKYVSFADEVTLDDIARGMEHAIHTEVVPMLAKGERFACITHSTGGPVARKWIDLFYRGRLAECPLGHLVMLAPANHGSALAQLGKGRLAQMKFFTNGVQPGKGVLDWLELGSNQGWELNREWLNFDCVGNGLYPFVLTGQKIDREFYDNLNSYTGEPGSDGVVRVAAANMNYGLIRLVQEGTKLKLSKDSRAAKSALGVLPGLSHSGEDIGILRSVKADDPGSHPTVNWVLRCLEVGSATGYKRLVKELEDLTTKTQDDERVVEEKSFFILKRKFTTNRYCMLVIRIVDDRGNDLSNYDVIFTAGPGYDANHLPPGFFVDRQRNQLNPGKLTYFIDYDVMHNGLSQPQLQGKFGVQVRARPNEGFAYYTVAEYQGTLAELKRFFEPNQTLMIEIELLRHVGEGVFKLTKKLAPEEFEEQELGKDIIV